MLNYLKSMYSDTYDFICGKGTRINILHFQYLAIYKLHKYLRKILKTKEGDIVDVGCGKKPYQKYFKAVSKYVGVDIIKDNNVDIVIKEGYKIPITEKFDIALCTQVLEHVKDLRIIDEIYRVLKKNGELILTVPFLYHVHDSFDFQRFTQRGIINLLEKKKFKVTYARTIGGIGSTTGLLFLAWFENQLGKTSMTRVISGLILPLKIFISFFVNILGVTMDLIDNTNNFYNGIIVIAKKDRETN